MTRLFSMIFAGLFVLMVSLPVSHAAAVTKIEDIQRGASVVLQGKVTRILDDDTFRLWDQTGSVDVHLGLRNRVMVRVGEEVTVKGFVDDDLPGYFRRDIHAQEVVRGDGTRILLNHYAAR